MIEADVQKPFNSFKELILYIWYVLQAYPGFFYKFRVFQFIYNSLIEQRTENNIFISALRFFSNPKKALKEKYQLQ